MLVHAAVPVMLRGFALTPFPPLLVACMRAASGRGGAVPRSRALPERLCVQGATCTRAGYPHARQLPMPVMLKPEALHTAASLLRRAGSGAEQAHNAGSSCCLQRSHLAQLTCGIVTG